MIGRFEPKFHAMNTKNLIAVACVGAGLAFTSLLQASESKGEIVNQKSLPVAVQKTITERAAGGKIVQVKREDDQNGKWNYEVVVKADDGKEWDFEVSPKGEFLKKHDNLAKQ